MRLDRAEQRRVGGVDQAALDRERAAFEQLQGFAFPFGQVGVPGPVISGTALSGTGGPVAVLARADVTARVQRQPAQRARRTAGRDEVERALRERAGRARA